MAIGNELENPQWNVHCAGETRKLHYTRLNTNLQIFFFLTQTHAYYIVIFSSSLLLIPFSMTHASLSLSLGGNSHKCTPTIINPAYLLSIHPINPNFTYSSKKKVKMLLALPDGIIDILYLFQSFHVLFLRERTNTICTTQPCFFFSFTFFPTNQMSCTINIIRSWGL